MPPYEVIALWKDGAHTQLDALLRFFYETHYYGNKKREVAKVEVYEERGVQTFLYEGGRLVSMEEQKPYLLVGVEAGNKPYHWGKIPVIPFKYNDLEMPLLGRVKSLQDALNSMLSDFANIMQEDSRNTILIIENYDGEDLGEFRRNLTAYGAVKVRSQDGVKGDVRALHIELNAENYDSILRILKKAIIENARGYDAKDERMSNNPNQMNIQSMYSDIDLDADGMETEFQASFEELLSLIHQFFQSQKIPVDDEVRVLFRRDVLVNENETINNLQKSVGIISDESMIKRHPYVEDYAKEAQQIAKEKKAGESEYDTYKKAFPPVTGHEE